MPRFVFIVPSLPLRFRARRTEEARAQSYPSRPISSSRVPAGGSSDVLCRLLGAKLAEGLGSRSRSRTGPGAAAKSPRVRGEKPAGRLHHRDLQLEHARQHRYLYKQLAFDATSISRRSRWSRARAVLVVHPSVRRRA